MKCDRCWQHISHFEASCCIGSAVGSADGIAVTVAFIDSARTTHCYANISVRHCGCTGECGAERVVARVGINLSRSTDVHRVGDCLSGSACVHVYGDLQHGSDAIGNTSHIPDAAEVRITALRARIRYERHADRQVISHLNAGSVTGAIVFQEYGISDVCTFGWIEIAHRFNNR